MRKLTALILCAMLIIFIYPLGALAEGEDITDTSSDLHTEETISDGQYDIPYYPLETAAVTRENMDEVIIEGGFHQREDVYLNVE